MGDYGISELVEMVERKLGRFWANALFALLLAATAAFAFSVLNEHAIQPLYKLAVWIAGPDTADEISYLIFIEWVQTLFTGVIGGIFGLVYALIYSARWKKKADAIAQELREKSAVIDNAVSEARLVLDEARKTLADADEKLAEARRLKGEGP